MNRSFRLFCMKSSSFSSGSACTPQWWLLGWGEFLRRCFLYLKLKSGIYYRFPEIPAGVGRHINLWAPLKWDIVDHWLFPEVRHLNICFNVRFWMCLLGLLALLISPWNERNNHMCSNRLNRHVYVPRHPPCIGTHRWHTWCLLHRHTNALLCTCLSLQLARAPAILH